MFERPPTMEELQAAARDHVEAWKRDTAEDIQTVLEGVYLTEPEGQETVIAFLRAHPDRTFELCHAVVDRYRKGDSTGIEDLILIIERLIKG